MNHDEKWRELGHHLSDFSFAEELSQSAKDMLLRDARRVGIGSGTTVLREGQVCDPIVLVSDGEIRVYAISREGREISLYHVGRGEACVLALCAVLCKRPYVGNAVIGAGLEGVAIPARTFQSLFENERPLRDFVLDMFSRRLDATMMLVSEVAFDRLDRRLAKYVVTRIQAQQSPDSPLVKTHSEIASELGTAREVVTRVLESFVKRGWLGLARGRITVHDQESLLQFANEDD